MSSLDMLETQYARSGDLSIAYQVVGEGPIDIVFVSEASFTLRPRTRSNAG